jgi:hypothetical protein
MSRTERKKERTKERERETQHSVHGRAWQHARSPTYVAVNMPGEHLLTYVLTHTHPYVRACTNQANGKIG